MTKLMQTLTKPITYEEFRATEFSEEEEKTYILS